MQSSEGCLQKADNETLKISIGALLFGISMCLLSVILPTNFIKSMCIIEKKHNEPYTCEDMIQRVASPSHHINKCGLTINYKTGYYLTEINSEVSKWACDTHRPYCNCCNYKGCISVPVYEEEKINGCYPIITNSLDTYQSLSNESMIDCWIDRGGNYLMKEQYREYVDISKIMIIGVMIILCLCTCVLSYVLLKRYYCKPNDIVINVDEIDMDYNIMK